MKTLLIRWAAAALLPLVLFALSARAADAPAASAPPAVTVTQDDTTFTLSNGVVTARVSKRSGDLLSLVYKGEETLAFNSGHSGGYWSHDTTGGVQTLTKVTIDPQANNGERGEVSVKGISGGKKMGHGAGAAADGDFPADIEIRYCLGRGDSGVYTYCIFDHLPEYPAATMTEARYCAKLADVFDWMTLDNQKDMSFPRDLNKGDKYIYTAVQFDHPVYGWSSTTKNVGLWYVNASEEYLSGGPTKVEFLCHRDTTPVAAPCIHLYWRSSHYGGAAVEVGQGEHWTKVVGPFMIYINSGGDHAALFKDAQAQLAREAAKWPYNWVAGVDYPHADQRASVKGRLVLDDAQAATTKLPGLLVGLTQADYVSPYAPAGGRPREITWQTDAKHYEFWVRGQADGTFTVPHVRPGQYTLRAFADGVLGELAQANVTVEAGKPLDLGKISWKPVRYGKQIWDIGVPNRNGSEFFHAEDYADPDISLKYPALFPNDVRYTIGASDYRKDWFFQQVPHNEDPAARSEPFYGVRSPGRATPYTVSFNLADAPKGTAILRLAICGTGTRELDLTVNGQPAGVVTLPAGDGAITRHSIQGLWYERPVSFDAKLLKPGANTLTLTVPEGPVNNGVIYDYLRLELNENYPFPVPAGT
ncbi:MAG TPA: polysaccharide lyase family protein [Opitutales bacterium]|nr:polysaccharide lyase family protein [Opitutales bacterium]